MDTPLTRNRFKLVIAGMNGETSTEASAVSIGSLESEVGVQELHNGSDVSTSRLADNTKKVGRLRVEFHLGTKGWDKILTWWNDVNNLGKPLEKRGIDLLILDDEENEVQKIRMEKAWPFKFGIKGASKEAESATITEFIEFITEKFSITAVAQAVATDKPKDSGVTVKPEIKPTINLNNNAKNNFDHSVDLSKNDFSKKLGSASKGALKNMAASAAGGLASGAATAVVKALDKSGSKQTTIVNVANNTGQGSASAPKTPLSAETDQPDTSAPSSSESAATSVAAGTTTSTPPTGAPTTPSASSPLSKAETLATSAIAGVATAGAVAGTIAGLQNPTGDGPTPPPDFSNEDSHTNASIENDAESAEESDAQSPSNEGSQEEYSPSPNETLESASVNPLSAAGIGAMLGHGFGRGAKEVGDAPEKASANPHLRAKKAAPDRVDPSAHSKTTTGAADKKAKGKKAKAQESGPHEYDFALNRNEKASIPSESEKGDAEAKSAERRGDTKIVIKEAAPKAKTSPIKIFIRSSGLPAPTIYIKEEGGETQSTIEAIREHLEKELRAVMVQQSEREVDYRIDGKKVSFKNEPLGLSISTYDMLLRQKIHERLRVKLGCETTVE